MNVKDKLLSMEKRFAEEYSREPIENVEDLLVTFIFKFQFFEPCKYLSEDDEWITFLLMPANDISGGQIMTVRKDDVVSFGILDEKNVTDLSSLLGNKDEPESLYQ
ncbi:hypothetical protein [uncultured Methanobrevibacter sp.]|uniref:hypothetical protein n=1 Tax=uncultured Methanobrevibacter sp. TaxID=253161 RepID=UPI0025F9F089|nr:hypothetical protein [uncultured Methanobrevibacter sp.]